MSLFNFSTPQQPQQQGNTLGGQNNNNNNNAAAPPDIEVQSPPPDGISSLSWSPTAEILAVGSWDNQVRIYQVNPDGTTAPVAMTGHEAPVLDICWSKDGNQLFSAGADKTGKMYDVNTRQSSQVAAHDAPIKSCRMVDSPNGQSLLATGSWDKTIKYWDLRSPNVVATAQLAERCYTMDIIYPHMIVGTAERQIQIFDLSQSPTQPLITMASPLKYQTRSASAFIRSDLGGGRLSPPGFAMGSTEGRVAIQYIEANDKRLNFSFKCHRKEPRGQNTELYSVNAISFHPIHGTFSSAGSDGSINFWDKDSKTRLKTFEAKNGPISATAFNRNGSIFAYAVSYDWHKGYSFAGPQQPNQIFLHPTKDEEVKRRPKK